MPSKYARISEFINNSPLVKQCTHFIVGVYIVNATGKFNSIFNQWLDENNDIHANLQVISDEVYAIYVS